MSKQLGVLLLTLCIVPACTKAASPGAADARSAPRSAVFSAPPAPAGTAEKSVAAQRNRYDYPGPAGKSTTLAYQERLRELGAERAQVAAPKEEPTLQKRDAEAPGDRRVEAGRIAPPVPALLTWSEP